MNTNEQRAEIFPGMVKYGGWSGSVGSVKWKMGAIVIDKDDKHGWKIKMQLDCSGKPILSYPLTADTLKKHVCKDTILIDVRRARGDKDLISFYLKANDKRAAKRIEALCMKVLKQNKVGSISPITGWSQTGASDAVHELSCTPCSNDGKNSEAKFHCKDCQMFDNHVVVSKTSESFGQRQRQQRAFVSRELLVDLCEEHHGEVIKMFCGQHDVVCCTVCIALKHRSCEGVEYLPNIAVELLKRLDKDKTITHMEKTKFDLQRLKSAVQNEMKELNNQRDDILQNIRRCKTRLIKRIHELEQKAMTDVQEKHKDIAAGLTANSKKIDNMLKDIEKRLDRLKHSKLYPEAQTFVDITYGRKTVSVGYACIQQSTARKAKTIDFQMNRNLESYLHEVQSLATPKVTRNVKAIDGVTQPMLRSASQTPALDFKCITSGFELSTCQTSEIVSNSQIPECVSASHLPTTLKSASETPAFCTVNQTPAFRSAGETPSYRTGNQTPVFGSLIRTPSFRTGNQTPVFGSLIRTPSTPSLKPALQTAERPESQQSAVLTKKRKHNRYILAADHADSEQEMNEGFESKTDFRFLGQNNLKRTRQKKTLYWLRGKTKSR
ncbi:uncharacterized protein LOC123538473 [Mercenaria mercenaria]|uniref:uncharacterized protein LOC123538473 n=1 Tax=Mercenaria mercenaria TaxID=6596 RepID=UPI00234F7C00|nr:uncharacterized protein LOC123538473 [Mercenaria mercenaria]